jgi:hypothetical protein
MRALTRYKLVSMETEYIEEVLDSAAIVMGLNFDTKIDAAREIESG